MSAISIAVTLDCPEKLLKQNLAAALFKFPNVDDGIRVPDRKSKFND